MPRLLPVTEKAWQTLVLDLARTLGWRSYHTHDSRRSAPGFPDLVLVRDRVIYAELKTETGRLRPGQGDWHADLRAAGAEVHVWRPSDYDDVVATLKARRPSTTTERTRDER